MWLLQKLHDSSTLAMGPDLSKVHGAKMFTPVRPDVGSYDESCYPRRSVTFTPVRPDVGPYDESCYPRKSVPFTPVRPDVGPYDESCYPRRSVPLIDYFLLTTGRFGSNLKSVISEHMLRIKLMKMSCEIALR